MAAPWAKRAPMTVAGTEGLEFSVEHIYCRAFLQLWSVVLNELGAAVKEPAGRVLRSEARTVF